MQTDKGEHSWGLNSLPNINFLNLKGIRTHISLRITQRRSFTEDTWDKIWRKHFISAHTQCLIIVCSHSLSSIVAVFRPSSFCNVCSVSFGTPVSSSHYSSVTKGAINSAGAYTERLMNPQEDSIWSSLHMYARAAAHSHAQPKRTITQMPPQW